MQLAGSDEGGRTASSLPFSTGRGLYDECRTEKAPFCGTLTQKAERRKSQDRAGSSRGWTLALQAKIVLVPAPEIFANFANFANFAPFTQPGPGAP